MEALKSLLLPSGLVLVALVLGLILLWRRRTRVLGMAACVLGALLYVVFASGPVSNALIGGLENRYAAADPAADPVDYIVVLSAWGERDGRAPAGSHVNRAAIFRLVEAMRLHRALPHATVLISGWEEVPGLMRESLLTMGMPADRIILETGSRSTHESAVHLSKPLRGERFLLVTSAGHMARSVAAFEDLELKPIPAPTDFLSHERVRPASWLPSAGHLAVSDLAMHEYLGGAWYSKRHR